MIKVIQCPLIFTVGKILIGYIVFNKNFDYFYFLFYLYLFSTKMDQILNYGNI
jgi:hypothetical protein